MIDFTLTVGAKSSYADNIRIRAFQDLGQQALAARRLKLIEDLDRASSSATSELKIGAGPAVVVDRQRRLAANLEGNQFTARQLEELVESILAQRVR
jgi:hypothetical protein